jgi:hypothetical protein
VWGAGDGAEALRLEMDEDGMDRPEGLRSAAMYCAADGRPRVAMALSDGIHASIRMYEVGVKGDRFRSNYKYGPCDELIAFRPLGAKACKLLTRDERFRGVDVLDTETDQGGPMSLALRGASCACLFRSPENKYVAISAASARGGGVEVSVRELGEAPPPLPRGLGARGVRGAHKTG